MSPSSAPAFCALGLALSGVISNDKSAPVFTNMIALPLYFVSDIFVMTEETPCAIGLFGDLFPVKHLAKALSQLFDLSSDGIPMAWGHWAVIIGWRACCGGEVSLDYNRMKQRQRCLEVVLTNAKACTVCEADLPAGPRPVLRAGDDTFYDESKFAIVAIRMCLALTRADPG